MRDDKFGIDSADGLVAYCKSVNSPVKMNKKCAGIILANCGSRDVTLLTDTEGHIYQEGAQGQEVLTTLDDVVDEVCEWNYEDIEAAKHTLKRTDDYIGRCRLNSQIEKLEKEARALNFIFYQTKYGRNVEKLADRIAKDVMEQLNLVPVYDVPFYEDKKRMEPAIHEEERETADVLLQDDDEAAIGESVEDIKEQEHGISGSQIVSTEFVAGNDMQAGHVQEAEMKGAR